MIPTFATTGETIAFGGRALGDQEPKYLNTSTTPVYTKGRYLYALNVARRAAAKEDSVIVVEGYLDCIALHQAGFANAVAALGTAFTPEQAKELRKAASRAILCFDADTAGVDAALKSIETLVAEGVAAWALRIPDGKDPDEFVRRNGADAFRALLAAPISATQMKIDAEIERQHGRVARGALAAMGGRDDPAAVAARGVGSLARLRRAAARPRARRPAAGSADAQPAAFRSARRRREHVPPSVPARAGAAVVRARSGLDRARRALAAGRVRRRASRPSASTTRGCGGSGKRCASTLARWCNRPTFLRCLQEMKTRRRRSRRSSGRRSFSPIAKNGERSSTVSSSASRATTPSAATASSTER